ncbi:hypothetical protein LEP1GSC058_3104 [Leptospira fainei serovar Hurstbridge str. BUT 6]|uniref:Dit-like phage tail protein N-terminal domain-containing protein n=1 Tax=Leptospira fainei serovar Hurstbridge str. BUT 6 TaxID=1193011 RepID=S3UXH2_9LEPT|nr:hypothetical protein [Leptospira fainei]EPG73953.1 hypothetical protein LEP1GSC058_3104 [Leptospira fainei serovar Hurstbridge str. BUT 6]
MPALTNRISSYVFGGRNRVALRSQTDDVTFDSTINITKDRSATATTHAIEKGADITDHVSSDPLSISFTAIISDADYDPLDPASFFNKKVGERLTLLKTWVDSKEVLSFFGYEEDEVIENVIIESYSEEQNVDLGQGRQIQFKLKQINIVDSKTQDIPLRNGVTKKGSSQPSTVSTTGNAGVNKPMCSSIGGG